jgi:threonine dehydrogenase-like Zn-dependent dehydrogenase
LKAVVFDDTLQFRDNVPPPQEKTGSVLVDVIQAGICETDLQLCRGYMGFQGILGHEFVGVARSGTFAGQRVVGEINCGCQTCGWCRGQRQNHCPDRTVIGILNHPGGFADTLLVPEDNLHVVPDSIDNDTAIFVEPLAAACRIPQQISLAGKPSVLVLGAGRLGNLCAQVLRVHGCDVTVRGRHQMKLSMLDRLGIATCDTATPLPSHKWQLVVDCTGSPDGLADALQAVQPCGTVVMKTTVAAEHNLQLADVVINEVTVVGSRCGPFDAALDLLSANAVDVKPLISARFPLNKAVEAFEYAARRDVLKVILDVNA